MKKFVFIVLTIVASCICHAQINFSNYSTSFSSDGHPESPYLITARPYNGVYSYLDNATEALENAGLLDSLSKSKKIKSDKISVLSTYDSSDVYFFAAGITKLNAPEFEYRVLSGDQEPIRNWSPITQFSNSKIQFNPSGNETGFLGGFKTGWNHYVLVELRRKGSDSLLSCSVVYWRPTRPAILTIYSDNELDAFLDRIKSSYDLRIKPEEQQKWTKEYDSFEIDPATFLPKKLVVKSETQNLIFLLRANVNDKNAIEYQLEKDGKIIRGWASNDYNNNFIWLKNLSAGNYILKFRFRSQRQNESSYPFEKQTAWHESTTFKIILGSLIAAFFALLFLLYQYQRQKQRLKKIKHAHSKITNELKFLHTQLNPHFIFNALNSIQSLIITGNAEQANDYLTSFSQLLRNTLKFTEQDFISLAAELKTLQVYIKLEQLRFSFNFHLHCSKEVDIHDIQVPVFLLQPTVENAIKHGLSKSRTNGELNISISRSGGNLIISVADNGPGFDQHLEASGYGMKITRKRLELLNVTLRNKKIDMHISSEENTVITFTFINWL